MAKASLISQRVYLLKIIDAVKRRLLLTVSIQRCNKSTTIFFGSDLGDTRTRNNVSLMRKCFDFYFFHWKQGQQNVLQFRLEPAERNCN